MTMAKAKEESSSPAIGGDANDAEEGGGGDSSPAAAAEPSPPVAPPVDQGDGSGEDPLSATETRAVQSTPPDAADGIAEPTAAAAVPRAAAAVEAQAAGQQSNNNNATSLPWYKLYQGPIIVALLFVIFALVAVLVTVVVNNQNNNEFEQQEPEGPFPPADPLDTGVPTVGPTSGPTKVLASVVSPPTAATSSGPSLAPPSSHLTSMPPSFSGPAPGGSPSTMPTSLRFIQVVQKLIPLSGEAALKEMGSPQYRAAQWIADEDPISNESTGGTGLDLDDPRLEQRYVMALFYFAMDGDNWRVKTSKWLSSESECYWFGIYGVSEGCGGVDASTGVNLGGCVKSNGFDKVCRISMGRNNNLYGEISSELGYLTEMRWFEIQDDFLFGTIPDILGMQWTKLHTFLVGGNYLNGGFPSTFENNDMLGTIFIDRNMFDGTFPSVFATLKNLKWLDAANNTFMGTMSDDIPKLRNLRILNVNHNHLVGNLPDSWDESNRIEDFEVAHNSFNGTLPTTLANAKFLKDLRASANELTGSIPVEYYGMTNLEELYLDENMLGGELPQTDAPFYDGLQEFSIHSNNFEGSFPVEHFEGTLRIKVLSLHSNQLTGTISENICARRDPSLNWSRLVKLTADCVMISCDCCTCYEDGEPVSTFTPPTSQTVMSPSQAPTSVSPLPVQVYVSRPTRAPDFPLADRDLLLIQEQIESTVLRRNASFDNMDEKDARYLALDWILNKDQRQLTVDDVNLSQRYVLALTAFSLDSLAWYVCGDPGEDYRVDECTITYWDNSTSTHGVWLSSTSECGWYGVTCSADGVVQAVDLNYMDLVGKIPNELAGLRFLQLLALPNNCIYGTIPPEIGELNNLTSLELHGNGLSGEMPKEIYNLKSLQLLNLAEQRGGERKCTMSNNMTTVEIKYRNGGLFDEERGFVKLEMNSGLTGTLGDEVGIWRSMKGLYLNKNSFVGEISEEIGKMRYLRFLWLHDNFIEGSLPETMTELKNLRYLKLEENFIVSSFPTEMGRLTDLEWLTVSGNSMYGEIPNGLYKMKKMEILRLDNTMTREPPWMAVADEGFTGSINPLIGDMQDLKWLFLNNNPMNGTIPTELGLCEKLEIVRVHRTNIGGTMPYEVCVLRDMNLNSDTNTGVLYSDCMLNSNTGEPFMRCDCCSDCCDHTTGVCVADD